jgi:hypothetical protein
MGRFHDPLVRGFGRIVAFDVFGADPFFGDKFYRRAEEVVEEPPFSCVEIIEKSNNSGMIQPFISDPLSYMGPVLLFYMALSSL